jgi:hypothetical protein
MAVFRSSIVLQKADTGYTNRQKSGMGRQRNLPEAPSGSSTRLSRRRQLTSAMRLLVALVANVGNGRAARVALRAGIGVEQSHIRPVFGGTEWDSCLSLAAAYLPSVE